MKDDRLDMILKEIGNEKVEPSNELIEETIKKCRADSKRDESILIALIGISSFLSSGIFLIFFTSLSLAMKVTTLVGWGLMNNILLFVLYYHRKKIFDYVDEREWC